MRILEIKALRGPNFWSIKHACLIQMKLDIGVYENLPTNKIDGFTARLSSLMPSLVSHHCSEGVDGGFFRRMREGTWLGHVIEHVALELQSLAGMDRGFGRTRSTGIRGEYYVVFSYLQEEAGRYAAQAAVNLVETLAKGGEYPLEQDIEALTKIGNRDMLGPSTQTIVDEAIIRGIPYRRLDSNSRVMFGQGKNQRIICAAMADCTSSLAVDLVQNKQFAKQVLEEAYIPVPIGTVIKTEEELQQALLNVGFPVVIKPIDGNHGRGITTQIHSFEHAASAFAKAKKVAEEVIVERYIKGEDYRILVINYKFVAASKRTPAKVVGDGLSTIQELIAKENSDPSRGEGHKNYLTFIEVDESTQAILESSQLSLSDILPFGQTLILKDTANLSSGGTAEDVTDCVHSDTVFLAERIARLMNLDICGIDLIAADISQPISRDTGAILEVNAAPGFRMHYAPSKGKPRNVASSVLDMLYPMGKPSRIPITAVTGTNGKTTTTRLLAHIAMEAGHQVGYTSTDGIYLNGNLITRGDCGGPGSAGVILRDPIVDYAVLECARGGILRSGLGFDRCNISIVTNISEDHLGMDGISSLEKLASVKSVVPESTFQDGYAVLNADDELVYAMRKNLSCSIALFSMNNFSRRIAAHCAGGGAAAFIENGWLAVSKGFSKVRLIKVEDIPITLGGHAECMIQNTLAAVLAATLSGFSDHTIVAGLRSFYLTPQLNPGRMNIFQFPHCKVIIDYAHNVGGYSELKKYMAAQMSPKKIGIIGATGDRREKDIVGLGELAAEIFDEIIIRHDDDGRGRTNEELTALLIKGIRRNNSFRIINVISDEKEALQSALCAAPQGALVFLSSDHIHEVLAFIEKLSPLYDSKALDYGT